jgi:hypothetical protein
LTHPNPASLSQSESGGNEFETDKFIRAISDDGSTADSWSDKIRTTAAFTIVATVLAFVAALYCFLRAVDAALVVSIGATVSSLIAV